MAAMTSRTLFGLAVAASLALPASALAARDGNHDGIPDRWEKRHHLSLKVDQSRRDQDHDGLRNRAEYRHHTNPRSADTDHDGLDDRDEIRSGHDPRDRDSDDDGIRDGHENAGTVKRFDGTTLVIALLRGGTVSGMVDATTELRCPAASATASKHGDDDPPGDDRGGHGSDDPPGDDHGGDRNRVSCGTDALRAGARVHEAELRGTIWHEVELSS